MPRRDAFHFIVKEALVKAGWNITHDPLYLHFAGVDLYIDLGASELIGAALGGRTIAVEVKSFSGVSTIFEFHVALGQFMNYRYALSERDRERTLYLAVPAAVHEAFFSLSFVEGVRATYGMKLIVCDHERREVLRWIE